jgi:hypothetical protein
MAKFQIKTTVAGDRSFTKLLMELNAGITDFALKILGVLLLRGGEILNGKDAYNWDLGLVIKEQGHIAAQIYEKHENTAGFARLEDISYSNIGSIFVVPNFGMFKASFRGTPLLSLKDD